MKLKDIKVGEIRYWKNENILLILWKDKKLVRLVTNIDGDKWKKIKRIAKYQVNIINQ